MVRKKKPLVEEVVERLVEALPEVIAPEPDVEPVTEAEPVVVPSSEQIASRQRALEQKIKQAGGK